MQRVQVLREEPALAAGLDPSEVSDAEVRCTAPTETFGLQRWTSTFHGWNQRDAVRIVLDGFGIRRVTVHGQRAIEVVGPGHVIAPTVPGIEEDVLIEARTLTEIRVAVLDRRFLQYAARWPEISINLVAAAANRANVVTTFAALSRTRGLEARLHEVLWSVGSRWGHMTPRGVRIPFRLTQEDLADLVAARRPSVTSSLRRLRSANAIAGGNDGHLTVVNPKPSEGTACPSSTERPVERVEKRSGVAM